ncbi:MAG: hypothetical protein JWQ07_2533 [Ramlibacter sp.]|nr:hypothetical protein [Ramlibacter sp.]
MKTILSAAAVLVLATACASGPEPVQTSDRAACRNVEARTGSRVVRRQDCARAEADRDQTQDEVRQIQDMQNQMTNVPRL